MADMKLGFYYCSKCNTIQSENHAAEILKTGFKALSNGDVYHVGTCKECEEKGWFKEEIKKVSISGNVQPSQNAGVPSPFRSST